MRRILLGAFLAALLGGAFVAYPLYPSPRTLCAVVEERAKNQDRWASPHRGAVLLLSGELYGLPEDGGHIYGLATRCSGYDYFVAIDASPYALQSVETRNTLHALQKGDWRIEERHAR